ncbi:MAG: ATP-binding protein [Rhodothermia bacterium]|nr:MAG: ATP-binding protein [Rhodothermia bacterium]
MISGLDIFLPISVLVFVATVTTYFSAKRFLNKRIELARATLRRTRKYKFEKLEEADFPKGDELNALVRQVYRTGQVLEREIRQLHRVENYRRVFIGNVSHELKTPVFAIQGFAETLLDGAIEDENANRAFVEKILHNAERLNNLAGDLIEISRLESGELQMTVEPFNLGEIVSDIIESLEQKAKKNRVTLRSSIPPNLPTVVGDPNHIRQVLVNLIDNALKYTDAGGTVNVAAVKESDGTVGISISDTGIGIAKKYIPRLTERFYRTDQSRSRSAGGTGLGLAIVKHILAAHKQQLTITSEPDIGSSFQFSLPLATRARRAVD